MDITIRLVHGVLWMLAAKKWGDYKNWEKYYSTMLFFALGNFIYLCVFHDKWLWRFQSEYILLPFIDLYVVLTVFIPTILIYFFHMPKKTFKKIRYMMMWVSIYTLIEVIMYLAGIFQYGQGWNIKWSFLHNIYQFYFLDLHQRKPIITWTLAFITLAIMIMIFNVPVLR